MPAGWVEKKTRGGPFETGRHANSRTEQLPVFRGQQLVARRAGRRSASFRRAYGAICFAALSSSDDGEQSANLRRTASASLHPDRRRLQHEFRDPRLSRRRRQMEADAAGDLSGLHGRGDDAPALLGAQPLGWRRFRRARPNDAHRALARLEAMGKSELLLTQNVDRLHQAAGATRVIDLHGRLDRVRCMGCERRMPRDEMQDELGPAERRLARSRRGRSARRRRRPRKRRLFVLPSSVLSALRRHAQARRRVFRRERTARPGR